jgi:hypothetical protein
VVLSLFVQTSLPGGDFALFNVLGHLDPSLFRPFLLLLKRESVDLDEIESSTKVFLGSDRMRRVRYSLPTIFRRLFRVAADHDILVGALELDSTYLTYRAGRLLRKPTIGWVRTTLDRYLDYKQHWHLPLLRAVYPKLDRVVFLNEYAATSVQNKSA